MDNKHKMMSNKKESLFFIFLLGLSALAVATMAAIFSVSGLGKLFAGSSIAIMFMAGALEFGKLICASYVYRSWSKTNILEKIYLIAAILVLMTITSAGIYGYLSAAYENTAVKFQVSQGQISLIGQQKQQMQDKIVRFQSQIDEKNKRIQYLTNLGNSRQMILDSLYSRKSYWTARSVESQIKNSENEINKLNKQNDSITGIINKTNDGISVLDMNTTQKQNENLTGETAPLQYIAKLFNASMDKVVNIFMMLLIFVFDPLSIILTISFNKSLILRKYFKEAHETIKENSAKTEPITSAILSTAEFENTRINSEKIKPYPITEGQNSSRTEDEDLLMDKEIENIISEFESKKEENKISYVANEDGKFIKESESEIKEEQKPIKNIDASITKDDRNRIEEIRKMLIKNNEDYIPLTKILYCGGDRKSGMHLPSYNELIKSVVESGLLSSEETIKNLLTIFVIFDVVHGDKSDMKKMVFFKNYDEALTKIELLQKN